MQSRQCLIESGLPSDQELLECVDQARSHALDMVAWVGMQATDEPVQPLFPPCVSAQNIHLEDDSDDEADEVCWLMFADYHPTPQMSQQHVNFSYFHSRTSPPSRRIWT